jgi:hypothetical protein
MEMSKRELEENIKLLETLGWKELF